MAEGQSQAALVARTVVEPLLDGRPLGAGLSAGEQATLHDVLATAIAHRDLFRVRLRELGGQVVFADDGSGFNGPVEEEVRTAASGQPVALLTRINKDANDTGPVGPNAVEVYMPLDAGLPAHRVGVLELYLPYAPISRDIRTSLGMLYRNLSLGLGLLWLVLLAISWSMSRRLREQVAVNAHQAEHDVLTGLPNRELFKRRVADALERAGSEPTTVAIADIDRFKEVNDALGHNCGDQLLVTVASRLSAGAATGDTVARLGGDEFGFVLCDADDPLRPLTTIRRLIMDELEINGLPVAVEASVGYVVAPGDGTEVDGLLQRADVAMFVAKRQRGGITRYEEELDDYDAASLSLLADLRHALDADELVLHYQPKLSLATGVADELEALVRWAHPTFGLLGPDRFIPLAEQTELIDRLTAWVLRRALRDLHRLDAVAPDLAVAVNVSTRNLSQTKFAAAVVQAAQEVGVPTGRIIVEMTETAILLDPRRAAAVLAELAAAGVRVSLDDFGSGQTSLGHLSSLPLHELKVDRSFVTDMLDSPAHAAIVRSIVDLGHNLGLRVVAEGVETQAVREGLLAMGCDMAQGYVLSRPMDLDATEQWLADHGRPRPDHPALETAPR